ncbi:MAG: GTP cyclohydrolase II [Bdellovibrionota bacterium]
MTTKFLEKLMTKKKTTVRKAVKIPIRNGMGTFITFHGLNDSAEHVAIAFGNWEQQETPLVRIHSECLTGDVFGSGKCDCGEQLNEAIDRMQKEGGILLYLRQEGRGIGLYNKLDAYELQALGYDTYEANQMLGLEDDLRDYKVAAQMLSALGKSKISLLSNNPDKRKQLTNLGVEIASAVSTGVFLKAGNENYLRAKVQKTNHRIDLKGLRKVSV